MKQKINLLYVITKLELGGAQAQLMHLIKGLDKSCYNIFLFTAQEGLLVEDALALDDLTVYRSRWLDRDFHPFKDMAAFLELIHYINSKKIDIVHTHSSKAGILGRWAAFLAKAKWIVHTVHGWSFNDFHSSWVRSIYVWLERMTARVTDRIIVVSNHDEAKGIDRQIGKKAQYQLVRYGIEKDLFRVRDSRIRNELGIAEGELVIGTVACLKPQKAPEDFIQLAFLTKKILPQARFLLIGDGVLRKRIETKISSLGLGSRVIVAGWRRDIPRLLSAMNVFVLTSLWEGLPIAVLEAMAAGIPVVATQTGGVSEVICEGESGFLVPCQDIASMLKRVVELLNNQVLKTKITQQAADNLTDQFSGKVMAERIGNLYRDLTERKCPVHAS